MSKHAVTRQQITKVYLLLSYILSEQRVSREVHFCSMPSFSGLICRSLRYVVLAVTFLPCRHRHVYRERPKYMTYANTFGISLYQCNRLHYVYTFKYIKVLQMICQKAEHCSVNEFHLLGMFI